MKKMILGAVIGIGVLVAGYAVAGYVQYVQDLATGQNVYSFNNINVDRFEWYSDVCYVAQSSGSYTAAISCLKK